MALQAPDQTPERGPAVGPHVIFGFDTAGRCTLSVGPGLENLGVRPGELVGKNLFDVYAETPGAVEDLHRVLAGEAFAVETDFSGRLLSVFYQPVQDEDGTVTGALGVSTDVTEQRRIEAEVRAARERSHLLAELSAGLTREALDPEALLQVVARYATEAVADVGAVWLRSPDGQHLEPRAVWHVDGDVRTRFNERFERTELVPRLDLAVAEALDAPREFVLDPHRVEDDEHHGLLTRAARELGLRTGLRTPLRSRGHLVGFLDVVRTARLGPFTEADVSLVADIAERCSLALDNALLLDAQRVARAELQKFHALAEASEDLIAIADTDDRIVYVNPRVAEYEVEVSDDGIFATIAPLTEPSAVEQMRGSLRTSGRWSGDLTVSLHAEQLHSHVDAFHLSHPDTGAPMGTAWIARDVTELRATEEALRAANSDLMQFKALVEASPDFIAIAGLDGSVRYLNPGGRSMTGVDLDVDVTTTAIADYLTPEGLDASVNVEQPAIMANGRWEGESTLRNRRGSTIPVAVSSFLMHDPETGEPFALATVQRDLTERLAAETALRDLADQRHALLTRLVDAQDAERARIAADVHDDPVQALAAVDLRLGLLRPRLREQAPQLLKVLDPVQETVTGATERLRALLFDLEPPDLRNGLAGAMQRAAADTFEGTEVAWTVDGQREPDVPDAMRAVAYRIAREALINVRKHAAAHQVLITVRGRAGGLEVSVADDGVGLGSDGDHSASPGHRGLVGMRDRAEVAGGQCEVRSRLPRGTEVTLWLPGQPPN